MKTLQLDPSPKNQLGKNLLPPELEAQLLAEGCVFAAIVPKTSSKSPITLLCCKRSIANAVREGNSDNPFLLQHSPLALAI